MWLLWQHGNSYTHNDSAFVEKKIANIGIRKCPTCLVFASSLPSLTSFKFAPTLPLNLFKSMNLLFSSHFSLGLFFVLYAITNVVQWSALCATSVRSLSSINHKTSTTVHSMAHQLPANAKKGNLSTKWFILFAFCHFFIPCLLYMLCDQFYFKYE